VIRTSMQNTTMTVLYQIESCFKIYKQNQESRIKNQESRIKNQVAPQHHRAGLTLTISP
jgi:hypothetical protein